MELIARIVGNLKEVPAECLDKGILEEGLMKWQHTVQKLYLAQLNKPVSGTKNVLVQRIMSCIHIDEAVKVVTEYRTWLDTKANPEGMDKDVTIMKEDDDDDNTKLTPEEEEKAKKLVNKRLCDCKPTLEMVSGAKDTTSMSADRSAKKGFI